MRIIIMGAPGAGKGTQAERLRQRLGIPSVSTGQILRDAIKERSPLGEAAKGYLDAGALVPDEIVAGLLLDRLKNKDCENGYILDGFPRTIAQAEMLTEKGIELDAVISIEVSDDEVERRMTGRRVCPSCGQTYHTEANPPRREGVCDVCSGELVRRSDDEPETVRERLRVYHEATEPIKGYYERMGKLRTIVSSGIIWEVSERILEALGLPHDSH
jgi:adenylate kinase